MTYEEVLSLIEPIIAPKQLNKIQQLVLYHCWQGLTYQEIANNTDYDLGYIKEIGSKLWQMLSEVTGERITKQNIQAGIKHYLKQEQPSLSATSQHDWEDVIDTAIFYGREQELTTLTEWTTEHRCRLIAITGIGGIGKTTLTAKLAEEIEKEFDYVFWRSLRDTPSFKQILTSLLQFLSRENSPLPETESAQLLELQKYLQSVRCLIILDNFDALFEAKQQERIYQKSYEGYGELLRRVGEIPHQSCLLITSRETPTEISLLQGDNLPVREWRLTGLESNAAQQLLATKGVLEPPEVLDSLMQAYQGNPLALKMIASSIQNLFAGDVQAFLQENVLLFKGIRHVLKSQIERLSDLEEQIMYWLAINREAVSLRELQEDIFPSPSVAVLLEALESLLERSLIERTKEGFTQQPVIMEYISEQLITQVTDELLSASPVLLNRYALLKATAKDYISSSQIRTIIKPLITQVVFHLESKQLVGELLHQFLRQIRGRIPYIDGYTLGNLLNLSNFLELDLTGFDFSYLAIWQADLRKIKLEQVNFAYANLSRSVFAKTFGGVSCVVFSPNGNLLATSDTSGEVQIWELTSFQQLHTFKADLVWTWAVVFSQDEKILFTAGDDYVIKIWDVQTGKCLGGLEGHTNTINGLTLHPLGNLLASCSLDTTIRLWSVKDFEQAPRILAGHQRRVWSVSFSPDGSTLVSGSEDLSLKLWNVQTGECLETLEGHSHWIKSVAFSPNGKTIASGSFDGVIKLWSAGKCLKSWQGHQATITTVTYSPDSLSLASSSYDETVKIWDIDSSQCVRTLTEHSNRVWSVSFSPDGRYLASGGDDNATRLWHLKSGNCAQTWKGHTNKILFLALNLQGNLLAVGQEDQTVNLWNLEDGKITKVLRGHKNRIWSVAFSFQNSSLLASGSADRTIKLWETETGECLQTLHGHQSWVWSVIFSLDGCQLISSSYDHSIKVWLVESGECLKTMQGHTGPVVSLSISPDGCYVASGSFDSTVKLWDLRTGQCIKTFTGHQKSVWPVVFSPDGRSLASGSYDQTIKLWEIASGNCLQTLSGHSASVMSLAFYDGHLISGSFDHTIKVWDIKRGDCLRTLFGHTGLVSALISNLDKSLISGSFDETIRLWDLQTGQCLSNLRTPRPYDGLNITGVKGLTENQRLTLKALGAFDGVLLQKE